MVKQFSSSISMWHNAHPCHFSFTLQIPPKFNVMWEFYYSLVGTMACSFGTNYDIFTQKQSPKEKKHFVKENIEAWRICPICQNENVTIG